MSKFLGLLAALAVAASPVMAQTTKSTDPVVQGRADIKAANKTKSAEISAEKLEREQAKAKAKAEMVAEKKENLAKVKAAKAEGKDPLVVQRELDAKANAAYKQKAKAADAKYKEDKKATMAKANASKAEANAKMQKETVPTPPAASK